MIVGSLTCERPKARSPSVQTGRTGSVKSAGRALDRKAGRANPRHHPHLQRARKRRLHRRSRACVGARCRGAGRRRRFARRDRRTRGRARRDRCQRARDAPRGQGRAGRRLPRRDELGAGCRAIRRSSRWTPTGRTSRSSCLASSPRSGRRHLASDAVRDGLDDETSTTERSATGRCATSDAARTSCSARAGWTGAESSTGRPTVASSRAAAAPTPVSRSGLPVRDVTGGYRAFTADALARAALRAHREPGLLLPDRHDAARVRRRAWQLVEVPITFVERERGASKMGGGIVVEAMLRVTLWGLAGLPRRFRKRTERSDGGADGTGVAWRHGSRSPGALRRCSLCSP